MSIASAGNTLIEISSFEFTVRPSEPDTLLTLATTVACPAAIAVATPAGETVATVEFVEVHVALPVKSFLVASLYVAVAVNCWLWPTTSDMVPVTVTDVAVTGVAIDVLTDEEPPLHPDKITNEIISADNTIRALLVTKDLTKGSPLRGWPSVAELLAVCLGGEAISAGSAKPNLGSPASSCRDSPTGIRHSPGHWTKDIVASQKRLWPATL
jgi:hypothetical protein